MHYVELAVVWVGLYVAVKDLGAKHVCLERDFIPVITVIGDNTLDRNYRPPPLQDILCWQERRHSFNLFHIYMEANKAVDFIAKCDARGLLLNYL